VQCRRLGDISWSATPTYIKMDIEGSGTQALIGATDLLLTASPSRWQFAPITEVSTCGNPNLIRSIAPEYKLVLTAVTAEELGSVLLCNSRITD